MVEVVLKNCTENGIEDMDVDGAKGGSNVEIEVIGFEIVPDVQDAESKVARVETEDNNGADADEVKEHDEDDEFSNHS